MGSLPPSCCVSAKCLPKCDQISVGRKHEQLPLSIALINWPVDVPLRKSVKLWFEFGVEEINIMNVNIVCEAPITGRGAILACLLREAKADGLAVHICVVCSAKECLKILTCP